MTVKTHITPCLWFDDQGEEAANYYTGIFRNSRILADIDIAAFERAREGKA